MKDLLFYDGRCPLCSKEIALLRRLKDTSLELVDIHSNECRALSGSKSEIELLSVLHLKLADNTWLSGIDALVVAWGHTPYGWLFSPLRWSIIKPIADWVYFKWADKRACKLGYKGDTQVFEAK